MDGCQTDSTGCPGLSCELCKSRSPVMAWHYCLYLNVCFSLPSAPPTGPTPTPACPSTIDAIPDITAIKKNTSKNRGIQIACRISHAIIVTYITRLLSYTAWLYCTIRDVQEHIQYFKSVFLEIQNVTIRSVF